jgi:hypothetical protein
MSVGASAIAQLPIGADDAPAASGKTPPKRTISAQADAVQQPEAR